MSVLRDLHGQAGAQAIIRAISTQVAVLGIETLAEGVELASHVEVLRRKSCAMVKGYLISRSVLANAVTYLVQQMNGSFALRSAS
ncbi:MAG: EAL domain-containing protein [Novosphingobium sp.]